MCIFIYNTHVGNIDRGLITYLLDRLPPLVVDPTLGIEKGLLTPRGDVDMDILQLLRVPLEGYRMNDNKASMRVL